MISHTKKQKSNTVEIPGHTRTEKSNTSVSVWTIKGIETETRIAIQKAAKKEGITLGKYFNIKLREAANESLKAHLLPVKTEGLKDDMKIYIESLKEDLQKTIKDALEEKSSKNKNFFMKIFR